MKTCVRTEFPGHSSTNAYVESLLCTSYIISHSVMQINIVGTLISKQVLIENLLNCVYEGVPTSFRTGHLERELKMVQFSATRCSCIPILVVSLESSATKNLLNECLLL
jgi:hypothetical protein